MSLLDDLGAWATADASLPTGTTVQLNRMQDAPDAVIVFNLAPSGTDLQFEGAFIGTKVHVRSRGATDAAAEEILLAFHSLVAAQPGTFQAGSTRVLWADCTALPAYIDRDEDQRSIYGAAYEFMVPA